MRFDFGAEKNWQQEAKTGVSVWEIMVENTVPSTSCCKSGPNLISVWADLHA